MQVLLISRLREQLQGFWVIPGGVAVGYALLTLLLLRIDSAMAGAGTGFGFGGDAAAARGILVSVAGGIISMTSLTLSLTVVTLQLASSQFTPRALKSLLADRINQVVAGSFVGTVAYALLVLRVVREETEQDPGFVPALSVTVCIGLALLALALLLLFVHHIGQIIKVEHIASTVGHGTLKTADRLYPEPYGKPAAHPLPPAPSEPPGTVAPTRPGYVETLALDRIAHALDGRAERVEVLLAPGDFATPASPVVLVWPAAALGDEQRKAVRHALTVSNERDLEHDVGFGIRQLTDIALRAVSPGINDPTTAVTCIGYLTAVLERLAGRELPTEHRAFAGTSLVLHARCVSFESHLSTGFLEIARFASTDPRVVQALLDGLRRVADAARAGGAVDREQAVLALARDIGDSAADGASFARDQRRLQHEVLSLTARADVPGAPTGIR